MNFEERINIRNARWLLDQFDEEFMRNSLSPTENEEFKSQFSNIKKILLNYNKSNGVNKTLYKKSPKDPYNILRDFASPSIQGLPSTYRGFLCQGIMSDVDMVNCHPQIILNICKKHNIGCKYLEDYCSNRKQLIQDKKVDKLTVISSINDYRQLKNATAFMRNLDNEIKCIQQSLSELSEFAIQFEMATSSCATKKSKNVLGVFMSNVATSFEVQILHQVIPFIQKKGIEISVLMFDGFMIYGLPPENLIDELSQLVFDKFDFEMKFSIKEHDCGNLVAPTSWTEPDFKNDYAVLKHKYETEFSLAYITKISSYSYKVGKMLCFFSREQMKQELCPIKFGNDGSKFFDAWCQDANRQSFIDVDIIPHDKECPEGILNLWTGFAIENITDFTPVDIQPILNHIKIQMNHDEACYEFMLNWLSNMFQFPSSTSVLVNISTEHGGTGKGLFIELLNQMVGKEKYVLIDDPERLFGRFNDNLQGRVLCHLDEMSAKALNPFYERLKSMVTNDTLTIEAKGQKPITVSNTLKFIGTTNNLQAFKIKEGDRRIFSVEGSEELRGNLEYIDNFVKIMNDKNYQKSFYDFLMARRVKQKLTHKDFPETQLMNEAKILNRDPVEDFAEEMDSTEYTGDELYFAYKQFIERTGLEFKLSKKQFEMKFGRLMGTYKIEKSRVQRTEEDDCGNKQTSRVFVYHKMN